MNSGRYDTNANFIKGCKDKLYIYFFYLYGIEGMKSTCLTILLMGRFLPFSLMEGGLNQNLTELYISDLMKSFD